MKDGLEAFRTFLPKYLSAEAQEDLFAELSQFPSVNNRRIYTSRLEGEPMVFQGDGLASLLVADLPQQRFGRSRVMVLSNTCDLSPDNKRLLGPRMIYCPIVSFQRYRQTIEKQGDRVGSANLIGHLDAIRMQRNSSTFFLPENDRLGEDAIAMLDRINNCDARSVPVDDLMATRLFTLSDYGLYLFLFKLSVHLTRIREGVSRTW